MQPRDYQIEAVQALWSYFSRSTGNPLVAMPTGTGKSVVIALFVRSVFDAYPSSRVLMLTHVTKLVEQNFKKLLAVWPTAPAGVYSAALKRRETYQPITFASIASVYKRADEFEAPDIVVVDEAHLVSPAAMTRYMRFLGDMWKRNPKMKVVGLSATCYRLGLGMLTEGDVFTDVCYDLTSFKAFNALVAAGYMAPLVSKRTRYELDVSEVRTAGGEFVQSALQDAVDKPDITYAAVTELVRMGADRRKWLIFASGVEHCAHIVDMLDSMGVAAVPVHSKLGEDVCDANYGAFERGEVRAAVNVDMLTTGVDVPDIDFIAVLRPTQSAVLWVQMLGRGTRPAPWAGKVDCLVGDFAGNTRRLGPINDPLVPLPKGAGRKGGPRMAPVKLCPVCGSYVHASATACPDCGNEFLRSLNISDHASDLPVMRTEADAVPQVDEEVVDRVTYSIHNKRDRPPSLKVSYFCGLRMFKEYICFEHGGSPAGKARSWWRERCSEIEPPATVQRAIDLSDRLLIPKKIRVWTNAKHPQVMSYVYE
jgi:DNA repair protein RadD